MHGLDLTFKTLAASTNEAAINVLCVALRDAEPAVRRCALRALASRKERRCGQLLLTLWPTIDPQDAASIQGSATSLVSAVRESLRSANQHTKTALDVVEALNVEVLAAELVEVAETHASPAIRQHATRTLIKLADQIGTQARCGRDQPSIRNSASARLVRSVERFNLHRNRDLIDAFLLVSTIRDSRLLQMLSDDSPHQARLLEQLRVSNSVGVAALLAGFIGRSQIPQGVAGLLSDRADETFRTVLLRQIGSDPQSVTLQHLKRLGRPACCPETPELASTLPPEEHAAALHVIAQSITDIPELVRWVVATIARGDTLTTNVAAHVLQRCDAPPVKDWVLPAIELAGRFSDRAHLSPAARMLGELIDLLGHPQPVVVRAAQHVLTTLNAANLLPLLSQLGEQNSRLLGSILMMVDAAVIDTVRDHFRHPLLPHRIEAIAAAEAFGIVDLLHDAFTYLVRNDHQEARRRAATALATAKGRETLAILDEMISMPASSVRDAAIDARQQRVQAAPILAANSPDWSSTTVARGAS